ncbi:hypothetical protein SDJN03_07049, partial [Cucurbita argyrosperma subsp. sororia]
MMVGGAGGRRAASREEEYELSILLQKSLANTQNKKKKNTPEGPSAARKPQVSKCLHKKRRQWASFKAALGITRLSENACCFSVNPYVLPSFSSAVFTHFTLLPFSRAARTCIQRRFLGLYVQGVGSPPFYVQVSRHGSVPFLSLELRLASRLGRRDSNPPPSAAAFFSIGSAI